MFQLLSRGVWHGEILMSLLFLPYANDLKNASKLLDPMLYAGHTNIFYSNKNVDNLLKGRKFRK